MELLAESEERFSGLEEQGRKSRRRQVEIKSVEGGRRDSRKEEKQGCSFSTRSDVLNSVASSSLTSLCDLELNGTARRRAGEESLVGHGNRKKTTKFNTVDAAEEEVGEVHKYVDDSWRTRYSSKGDAVLVSQKDDSMKENISQRRSGVNYKHENVVQRNNLAQQVNSRENMSHRSSQKVKRISEVQSDDLKNASVLANAKMIEKGKSSASATRQSSGVHHQAASHVELRRTEDKQSKVADFHSINVQNTAYPQRDFQKTTIRGREEQSYLEQNLAKMAHDESIQLDQRAIEQDESTRSTQKLTEVSVVHGSTFVNTSRIDDKRLRGLDARTNLVQDSVQAFREETTQMALLRSSENNFEEGEEKLAMNRNSIQLRRGEGKQIDRRLLQHDELSEVHSSNLEALSLFKGERITGMESKFNSVQSSIPVTKNKGTQVEMNDAYHDQLVMSGFNAKNIVNSTGSWNPSDNIVDPQEYNLHLDLNQVYKETNKQAFLQYNAGVESQMDTNEFDVTRRNSRKISSLQDKQNSKTENKNKTSSAKTSVVLSLEEEMQRSSLTRGSSNSSSMQMASTGSLHGISISQPIFSELNDYAARSDIHQIQHCTNTSASKSDKSSSTHVGKFDGKLDKEIVDLNESGKTLNVSSGIQIREPGRRDMQATSRIENRKETFSTELTQERKVRESKLFFGESSQSKSMLKASENLGGVSSSLDSHTEVDNDSDRDVIHQLTNDAIESSKQFDKYSAFHVDEFVGKMQQEIMTENKSGTVPNVFHGFQTEETVRRESQETVAIDELNESIRYRDGRSTKKGGRLSSSEFGIKGSSDEMWDVQGLSSKETSNAEEPEEDFPTSGAIDLTTPTLTSSKETAITRRSPKSLWSYVIDIIRMSWVLQGHSHSSTLESDKRASSDESLSTEAWFSGHEPDEVRPGDMTQHDERINLLKESTTVKDSVDFFFEEDINEDRLAVTEPNSSVSSGLMKNGLSAKTASLVEAEHKVDAKLSHGIISSVAIVEQEPASKAEAALPSTMDIIESRARGKAKVLKPSSSYPVAMRKIGFSSSITQATDVELMEVAEIREGSNSGLENFEEPSVSADGSALPRITEIEEVDKSGNSIPKFELESFREKLPEFGGIKESEMKRRKFQRNKQVPKEQFDEWEEAFKLENEQKKLDEIFMKEAILEAKKGADTWEVPVGAVLVQSGKIIARGFNMVEELRDSTAHAEMLCIRDASNLLKTWRLAETTLYVTLEPCPMCAGAILQSRIDTVVWGSPNRLLGADGSWVRLFPGDDGGSSNMDPPSQIVGPVHPFHPKIKIRRGVLATECGDVMQQFFKLRRKKDKKPESSPPSCLPISNRPTKFFTKLHNIFSMMFCL